MTWQVFLILAAWVVVVAPFWATYGDRVDAELEHTYWTETEEVES